MKKLTLPSGDWLMVKVPKDAYWFEIDSPKPDVIVYAIGDKDDLTIPLPPRNYTIYGAEPLRLTEKEWKLIVGLEYFEDDDTEYYHIYECPDMVKANLFFDTATESGYSLIRANGFTPGETIILKVL